MHQPAPEAPAILAVPVVLSRLGVSRNTLLAIRQKDPTFPKPLKLGVRALRWRAADIDRWIEAGIRAG